MIGHTKACSHETAEHMGAQVVIDGALQIVGKGVFIQSEWGPGWGTAKRNKECPLVLTHKNHAWMHLLICRDNLCYRNSYAHGSLDGVEVHAIPLRIFQG